jgi:hypothetical protein
MLSVEESRRILGETAKSLSDEEIREIRNLLQELAEIALEPKKTKTDSEKGAEMPPVGLT